MPNESTLKELYKEKAILEDQERRVEELKTRRVEDLISETTSDLHRLISENDASERNISLLLKDLVRKTNQL